MSSPNWYEVLLYSPTKLVCVSVLMDRASCYATHLTDGNIQVRNKYAPIAGDLRTQYFVPVTYPDTTHKWVGEVCNGDMRVRVDKAVIGA